MFGAIKSQYSQKSSKTMAKLFTSWNPKKIILLVCYLVVEALGMKAPPLSKSGFRSITYDFSRGKSFQLEAEFSLNGGDWKITKVISDWESLSHVCMYASDSGVGVQRKIQVGDVIKVVNGSAVADVGLDEMRQWLQKVETIELEVRSGLVSGVEEDEIARLEKEQTNDEIDLDDTDTWEYTVRKEAREKKIKKLEELIRLRQNDPDGYRAEMEKKNLGPLLSVVGSMAHCIGFIIAMVTIFFKNNKSVPDQYHDKIKCKGCGWLMRCCVAPIGVALGSAMIPFVFDYGPRELYTIVKNWIVNF